MVAQNRFYVYAYLREDGTPYYVGKGKGERCYWKGGRPCGTPKSKDRILKLADGLSEQEAFSLEEWMISGLGRQDIETGPLHNRSNGGEGNSGRIVSQYTRSKMSVAATNRSPGHNEKIAAKLHLPENQAKRLAGLRSADTRAKLSAARSKNWVVTTPLGKTLFIKNLNQFCRENSLNSGNMSRVAKGTLPQHKGFTVAYA